MSETNAQAVDSPLSVDDAIASLLPKDEAPPEAAPEAEAEPDEEQPAEAQPADGDDPPEESVEAEAEPSDPESPAIAPPDSWDAAGRAKFVTLPRDVQQLIADRDSESKRAVSRAMTEASEAKKRAETEASGLGQYKAALDQLIPQAQRTFADRWANVDWVRWASEDPAAAQVGRFQYDQEQQELARLQAVHQQTADAEFAQFLKAENERLKDLAPDLADPKQGPAKLKAIGEYLTGQGIQPQALRNISATEMTIAHKAMLWDQAQTKAKAELTRPRPAAAARPAVKPAAAQPQSSSQRSAQQAANRFAQTRSEDDAVALLLAKRA